MTVIEVLVSLGIIGSALAATNLVQGQTTSALRTATERDAANELARATLEEAKAYGCGLVTGTEPAATLTAWRQHCWGGLGDSSYTRAINSVIYKVTLHTEWTQVDAPAGSCAADTAIPDGLVRQVTVTWQSHAMSADDYESVPPDAAVYRNADDGALVINGPPGQTATVALGATTISRAIGPDGCDLFGFLPSGQLSWAAGATTGTALISPGQVTTA